MANMIRFLGNFRVNSKADISGALEALKDRPLYAEKWAHFKMVSRNSPKNYPMYTPNQPYYRNWQLWS